MSANDKQIGGTHYKRRKIQHWDYAAQLPYLEGLATKYIDRHREKGGKQDLLKAIHTIEKMIEEYYGEIEFTPAEVSLGLHREPSYAEVRMGMGMTEPKLPVEAKSYLCSNASDGMHKFSHVYKHDKDGRLKEVLKCDLCSEEQERKS